MRRFLPWLIALLAVVGCLLLFERDRAAQETVLRLTQEQAMQARQLQAGRARLAELERKYTAASASLAQATASLKAAGDASAGGKDSGRTVMHMHDLIRQYPEMEGIWRKELRRNLLNQYGTVFANLNLPPDQLEKLKDLLVDRQASQTDAADAAIQMGIQPDTPEMQKAQQEARQAVETEIKGLLSPEAYAMVNNNNNSYLLQAPTVDLKEAGIALSPDQTLAISQALSDAGNPQRNPQGRQQGYYQPDPQTNLTPLQQSVLQKAAGILSPAQLGVLQSDWADQNKQNQIMQKASGGSRTWSLMWD